MKGTKVVGKKQHQAVEAIRSRIVGEGMEAPDQLLANPLNWRRHPKEQLAALEGMLDTVGWVQRVIVNRTTGHLVDGHARVELALRRDEAQVPVLYVELTEAEERLVLAALDPIGGLASTDQAMLDQLLADVGQTSSMLDDLLGSLRSEQTRQGNTDPDDVPPTPAEPVSRLGDVWVLGRHRIVCGDCTDPTVMASAMGRLTPDACVTDPPYGLGDTSSSKNKYDTYQDTSENLRLLIAGFLPMALDACRVVVLSPGNANQRLYPDPSWVMAWFTPAGSGSGPWGFCCWQPLLCYGKDPKLSGGKGRHPDAIVHTESAERNGHPCPKPIAFWSWLIERVTDAGHILWEPFSGSGTTIVACEKTNRICCACELSPAYVDVAVRRWQDFTGEKAIRESDGLTFDEALEAQTAKA